MDRVTFKISADDTEVILRALSIASQIPTTAAEHQRQQELWSRLNHRYTTRWGAPANAFLQLPSCQLSDR